jgi:hypothetical protein
MAWLRRLVVTPFASLRSPAVAWTIAATAVVGTLGVGIWVAYPGTAGNVLPPPSASANVSHPVAEAGVLTPTVADDVAGDRSHADQLLASSAPALADLIREVETSNVAALMADHVAWTSSPCTPPGQQSVTVSMCTDLGVPVNTVVRMFPRNVLELWWQPDRDIRTNFDLYLADTHPTLELVAKKDDGSYFLSFGIDGRHAPDEHFDNVRVTFRTASQNPGMLTEYALGADTSTPLDTIRMDEHYGDPPMYDVIYIAPALKAKEQAWHDLRQEQDQEPPSTATR